MRASNLVRTDAVPCEVIQCTLSINPSVYLDRERGEWEARDVAERVGGREGGGGRDESQPLLRAGEQPVRLRADRKMRSMATIRTPRAGGGRTCKAWSVKRGL
jgi:hypothetical protein